MDSEEYADQVYPCISNGRVLNIVFHTHITQKVLVFLSNWQYIFSSEEVLMTQICKLMKKNKLLNYVWILQNMSHPYSNPSQLL